MNSEPRFRCRCGEIVTRGELLTAISPFDPTDALVACPHCLRVEGQALDRLCDEPGCNAYASCGWPDGDGGYRLTCAKHEREEP